MARSVSNTISKRPGLLASVAVISLAVLVSGCASSKRQDVGTHSPATGSVDLVPGSTAARQNVDQWAGAYEQNRQDPRAIMGYADALSKNGQIVQAHAVLRSGVIAHPKDRAIASAYGKVLAMNGNFDEALNVIQRAQTPQTPDWRLLSAEGAVYDQMGQHDKARALYQQALKIQPDEPSLLNNLGLSHLLADELPEAEYTLRRAAALPGADSRVRQNLALVLGLRGKFSEAEQIATAELDPRQAQANIAYLRSMLQNRG
ncbi:hypothetical protein GCM10011316_31730 [Roseibium aquae]|uniref:Flp pilus assembly protein TadD n=1 Tax=Roseibium aquae TaxID=1323746 RepID=A0A916TM37_9HYPH|nr:tetratricopeptide repeat protein [Roseibium aquae]GGB57299.1 hypothetical protein GCM10011316_31730 [Roseibium aquae]